MPTQKLGEMEEINRDTKNNRKRETYKRDRWRKTEKQRMRDRQTDKETKENREREDRGTENER